MQRDPASARVRSPLVETRQNHRADVPRRRVLWLSQLLPYPPHGGASQRSFHLLKEVARLHDVWFVGFAQSRHRTEEDIRHGIEGMSEVCRVVGVVPPADRKGRFARWGLATRGLVHREPYAVARLMTKAFRNLLKIALDEAQPDLLHFDTLGLAHYRSIEPSLPAVLTHHNIESQMMRRRAAHEPNLLRKAYFHLEATKLLHAEKRASGWFDRHLVCSELDAERLRTAVGPVPVSVVPNGVDVSYFRPGISGACGLDRRLVFAGGLGYYPNASAMRYFLDEVWPGLKADFPDATIDVIGRDPPAWLSEAAGRDDRVSVPGFVDDVRPYIDRAAVYVCPIFDGGGTKLKMLDALAMGKAIVAHPVACEGLEVEDGVHVAIAETPDEFRAAIGRLLLEPELRKTLGASGRAFVEETYSTARIGHDLAALYGDLA